LILALCEAARTEGITCIELMATHGWRAAIPGLRQQIFSRIPAELSPGF
jgi:hypothetical protein